MNCYISLYLFYFNNFYEMLINIDFNSYDYYSVTKLLL